MVTGGADDRADAQFPGELERQRTAAGVAFDAIVIGTGFGGAVTACRLVEAGFKVCILERGRRYGAEDFPTFPTEDLFVSDDAETQFAPPPDFSRWLWSQDHGLYDVRDLADTLAVQAAGYGGGSLIYVNVHLRPPDDVFHGWPSPYSGEQLRPYFDLAACMLGAAPIPQRLAKTLQLRRAAAAAERKAPEATLDSWFRTPLAINFTHAGRNRHGRDQNPCDMRARCWRGCDRQAKNTLDLNYLARAENGECDIRTMAEARCIHRKGNAFEVRYRDLLQRRSPAMQREDDTATTPVSALYVFLCAGAVNTTELLFRSSQSLWGDKAPEMTRVLGSRYSPNADTLSAVFDCDQPHEADYGPTVTSAVLYDQSAEGEFSRTLEFTNGRIINGPDVTKPPRAGTRVTSSSGGAAILAHESIIDWGSWTKDDEANGTLVLTEISGAFRCGDVLTFETEGTVHAGASARSSLRAQRQWFLVQEGGYPRDIEALLGVFRSPLWLRRNRYLETAAVPPDDASSLPPAPRQSTPLRRPPTRELRLGAFAEALGGTGAQAFRSDGAVPRTFAPSRTAADVETQGQQRELLLPGVLTEPIGSIFPPFFARALENDRAELLAQAAAFALPMLSRMLDDLSASVASQIDPDTRKRLSPQQVSERQVEVLVRGLVRQVLQILAGSEITLADKAARALLNPVPETPGQLVNLLADALLWAIGYDTNEGHTALLFTMGRDTYRGRLVWNEEGKAVQAKLPTRVLDTASASHERVLREIAIAWRGELRTNPGWTTLGKRVTVHSQGGCPMGEKGRAVTDSFGEVYDCKGLYVMDAAAFPGSVGVNPSATIAAVAEYKVEQFIQQVRRSAWRAPDHEAAAEWVALHGRAVIDPLNSGGVKSRPAPSANVDVLGLTFSEMMQGFCIAIPEGQWKAIDVAALADFPTEVELFLEAEGLGIARGEPPITVCLDVRVPDLARLVAGDRRLNPPRLKVGGHLKFAATARSETDSKYQILEETSFLQLFVRPRSNEDRRFFHYHLEYRAGEQTYVLDGVKVLCDAPGFDVWHDTSTLYCQLTSPKGPLRGVLRLSIETLVRHQLPSFNIIGTNDPARQSWALLAFYKYFASELTDIYMKRLATLKATLFELVTSIHV